jgi:hypothetical protein
MKWAFLTACLALPFASTSAPAQILTVVPISLATVEGNSASSSLFQAGPASVQAYFSEAFLNAAGITPGAVIDGLAYRRNTGGATGPAGDTNFASYNIFMSQSFADPASMTTTFANNVVGPQTQVHFGSLTFPANSMPGGATPNAFGQMLDFSTPYTYAGGSLLVEVRRSARTGDTVGFNTDVDNTAAIQLGTRWLFNTGSDTATTGTLVVGGQIFQLQYTPIPEPSSLALIAAAGLATYWARRRRHSS